MDTVPVPADQTEVIAFLSEPSRYGASDGLERIDTHCSIVFLVGDRAYKLKRAIRYASLDYTTRAARRRACEAELVLNRRTAPDLYLGVRSINQSAEGALAFDGPGPALDHVVVMRRFAQTNLFDSLLENDGLTPAMMRGLGEEVARLHAAAEVTPAFGGSVSIRRVIADNDRELARVAGELDGAEVGTLSSRTTQALDAVASLLDRRRANGKVRRCHGDLRLANICLWSGRPTLFDCIEFSDEISCIDVLYDLAFLLMDLRTRGRGDLGNAVFNAWMDRMRETEGLRALPLFLALRAATRSYALAGAARRQIVAAEAEKRMVLARRHIQAGIDFLRAPRPLLIAVGGASGPERADLAPLLASMMPAPGARILHASDSEAWREGGAVLAVGCSVLIEGAFSDVEQRKAVMALATRVGVRGVGLFIGSLPATEQPSWHTLGPHPSPEQTKRLLASLAESGTGS